jgi:hypothetical protein
VLPFLRRRLWVVILFAILASGVALLVARGSSTTYAATGYLLVPANGKAALGQPSNPSSAEGLAETYAVLLTNDPDFTRALFNASTKTPAAAAAVGNLSLVSLGRTSVIRVTTSSPSAQATLNIFSALRTVVTQATPVSPNIIPDTLRVLQQPTAASQAKNYHKSAPFIGGLLGAVLGAFLGLVLERARPRIDDPEDSSTLTGLPMFDVRRGASGPASLAMQTRLTQSSTPDDTSQVVIIGVGRRAESSARWTARALQGGLTALQSSLPSHRTTFRIRISAVGDPTRELDGVWLAQDADETWLSIPDGIPTREVNKTLELLDRCGVRPTYVAMSPRRQWGRRSRPSVPSTTPQAPRDGTSALDEALVVTPALPASEPRTSRARARPSSQRRQG